MTSGWRALLLVLHRWIGLTVGLILGLAGITGSILVFEDELDAHVFNRDMWAVETSGTPVPKGELLDRLVRQRPDASSHAVSGPIVEGHAVRALFTRTVNGEELSYVAALNPHTGAVQGEFERHGLPITRRTFISVVYEFHRSLFAGAVGQWVIGLTGVFSLFLILFGTVIWWPKGGKWAVALTYKRGSSARRSQYDIHKMSGVYLGLAIAALSFTGIYLAIPAPFKAVVGAVGAIDESLQPIVLVQEKPFIGGMAAQKAAERHFPDATTMLLFAPAAPDDSYLVSMRHPHYPRTSNGGSLVYVDPYSGDVLAAVDSREAASGTAFLAWMFPIHNAEITGMPGRVLLALLGPVPPTLFVTGFLLWRHRRAGARKKLSRTASPRTV